MTAFPQVAKGIWKMFTFKIWLHRAWKQQAKNWQLETEGTAVLKSWFPSHCNGQECVLRVSRKQEFSPDNCVRRARDYKAKVKLRSFQPLSPSVSFEHSEWSPCSPSVILRSGKIQTNIHLFWHNSMYHLYWEPFILNLE